MKPFYTCRIFWLGIYILATICECTSDHPDYPKTGRIVKRNKKGDLSCMTKTILTVSMNKRTTRKPEPLALLEYFNTYCKSDEPVPVTLLTLDKDTFDETLVTCFHNKTACKPAIKHTNPKDYRYNYQNYVSLADEETLKLFASLFPINSRVDLTSKTLKVCKDPYGRFYNTQTSFNKTCPLIGFHKNLIENVDTLDIPADGKFVKLMPTNLRELRWILENRMNESLIPHRFLQIISSVDKYRNKCILKANYTVYVCGFPSIAPQEIMPVTEKVSLCPYGVEGRPHSYRFSYNGDLFGEFYPSDFEVDVRHAIFRETCFAKVEVSLLYTASGDEANSPTISQHLRIDFDMVKDIPASNEPIKLLDDSFLETVETAIIQRRFQPVGGSRRQVFWTTVQIPSDTLEKSMIYALNLINVNASFPTCYYMSSKPSCQFQYRPYCDDDYQHDYDDTIYATDSRKIGNYNCIRHVSKDKCDYLNPPKKTIVVHCVCSHFMCDDPHTHAAEYSRINRELEDYEKCFISRGDLVTTVNARRSQYCYMSITRNALDNTKTSLEFGILDMNDPMGIISDVFHCESLEDMEAALFASTPRDTSCRINKQNNVTRYQCCCYAGVEPCNTENLIQKYFSLQTRMELHSCQFHTHPTGPCAGSRYEKFRCIGVFDVTRSNGLRNFKEDCVASNQDNDRASTLCRHYGGLINSRAGQCGMMALYKMQKGKRLDETDLPIYVCCGDKYADFEKKLRTRKLKRISDFVKKKQP